MVALVPWFSARVPRLPFLDREMVAMLKFDFNCTLSNSCESGMTPVAVVMILDIMTRLSLSFGATLSFEAEAPVSDGSGFCAGPRCILNPRPQTLDRQPLPPTAYQALLVRLKSIHTACESNRFMG